MSSGMHGGVQALLSKMLGTTNAAGIWATAHNMSSYKRIAPEGRDTGKARKTVDSSIWIHTCTAPAMDVTIIENCNYR